MHEIGNPLSLMPTNNLEYSGMITCNFFFHAVDTNTLFMISSTFSAVERDGPVSPVDAVVTELTVPRLFVDPAAPPSRYRLLCPRVPLFNLYILQSPNPRAPCPPPA